MSLSAGAKPVVTLVVTDCGNVTGYIMFCSRFSSQPPSVKMRMLTDEMRMLTDEMCVTGLDGRADGGLLAQRQGPCRVRESREQPQNISRTLT